MYVCMYVWLCWVFISVRGLSLVVASGGHSSSQCGGHSSSRCAGLSLSRPLVAEHRLQTRRPSNCGSWAELLRGMWDLPRPGLKPASPALAGRFSTTAPPGKPLMSILDFIISFLLLFWLYFAPPFSSLLKVDLQVNDDFISFFSSNLGILELQISLWALF